jgi:arginine exporter protein ArgO
MGSKAQVLKPEMINVGNHHAAMKNNAHEAISKRYVAQDSNDLTLSLDRLNSAAAISQAISGSAAPMINSLIENWIARVKCIATSVVWLPCAAIKIKHAKKPNALRKISAVVNLCPIRLLLASSRAENAGSQSA